MASDLAMTAAPRMMVDILPFERTRKPAMASAASQRTSGATTGTHADDDWGRLMQQAQGGDRDAYQALLLAAVPWLRGIARRYLGNGEDAEDAVQDILLIVHRVRHTYDPGRPFKPWLGTLASRRCIDLLRKRVKRQRHEVEVDPLLQGRQLQASAPPTQQPGASALRAQDARSVRRAVDALPDRQREAIRLLRLDEMTLAEASSHSGQSIGALKVACHRALKSLRRNLHAADDDDVGSPPHA